MSSGVAWFIAQREEATAPRSTAPAPALPRPAQPNIDALTAQLGLDEDAVFTPFTNSSFYSPDGLEATAPVFGEATAESILSGFPFGDALKDALVGATGSDEFPLLPSPLGQVLATVPYFEQLPLADRASMVGLLVATIDW